MNIKILVFKFFSKMIKLIQNEICLFGWFVIIDVNNSSHLVLFTKLFDYNVFVSFREAWVWEYVCVYTHKHAGTINKFQFLKLKYILNANQYHLSLTTLFWYCFNWPKTKFLKRALKYFERAELAIHLEIYCIYKITLHPN